MLKKQSDAMSLVKRSDYLQRVGYDELDYHSGGRESAGPENQESLLEYWHILWRRKWTIGLFTLACGLIGLAVALLTTPVYMAKTTIEVQDVSPGATSVTVAPADNQSYSALSDIQTQLRILQSDTVAMRTVDKLEKTGFGGSGGATKPKSTPFVKGSPAGTFLLMDAARSLKVREVGPTRILEVVVESPDSYLAAAYANTVANEFIDQNMEARWKMSQRTGDWLGRELEEMRAKLERSDYALQAYAQRAGLLFADAGDSGEAKANVSGRKLSQIQAALSSASTDRVSKESKYEIAKEGMPESIPDVLNDPTLREYQARLVDLKRQIAELSAIFTPDFAKIKRLQGQVQSIQSAFDLQRVAVLNKIKNEYDEAKFREKLLSSDFDVQAKTVTSDAEKAIQYNLLKREVDSNRTLYEAMLQRVKESRVNAALKASNIRVIDSAKVPLLPARPNRPVNVAMGLFLGTLFGMAFVVVREKTDSSVRVPGDGPRWLNVPELGVIPSGSVRVSMHGAAKPLGLEASSSFTTILASIMFSAKRGPGPRVIVFTSANPSEGKTTVAANIALKCSEIGKKVLIIDTDFARPHMHEMFGVPNTTGFSNLMQMPSLNEVELRSYIREISPSLFVLPSGRPLTDTNNLLFSGRIPELLDRLKKTFDMILIDTPPTPQFAHARVLGRIADGVVLVTRSGQTSRETALATVQRFSEDRSHVLGTILNDWNPTTSPSNYYWQRGNRAYVRWEAADGIEPDTTL